MSRPIQLSVLVLLLLVACGDDGYHKAIQAQHARAVAAAEAYRMEQEAKQEVVFEVNAERQQAELAFESEHPSLSSEDELHQVLGYYCGDCHFYVACGSCEWGGYYFNTLDEMVKEGTLIPGNAEGSSVVQQMREHRVTLPAGIPPVTDVAIRLVTDFINQLPTPDAGTGH